MLFHFHMAKNIKTLILTGLAVLSFCLYSEGKPASSRRFTVYQPDGTSFEAVVTGDEWYRIKKTTDGHAIIHDPDGWWSYAVYNADGTKTSTGHHVGKDAPAVVLAESMNIRTEAFAAKARKRQALLRQKLGEVDTEDTGKHKRGLVILAEYDDVKFTHTQEEFYEMMNGSGYGGIGSAKDYYDEQFAGRYEFIFDVSPVVTLSHDRKYYGANTASDDDIRPAQMIAEACRLAKDAGVDFTLYDSDNDGEVDNVHVFYAGGDEAEYAGDECIWAHQWYITTGAGLDALVIDGKMIDRYSCSSELAKLYYNKNEYAMTGIGAFCHEFGHTLGLPDFYDTDYEENGYCAGLWRMTSLMDGGNYNDNSSRPPYLNAIEREILGLGSPEVLVEGKSYSLEPVHMNGKYFIWETDRKEEYYIIECRKRTGWDSGMSGEGMLVYHIDKTKPSVWSRNTINNDLSHQYADLIEADGRSDDLNMVSEKYSSGDIYGIFFPGNGVTSLSSKTHSSMKYWSGKGCTLEFRDIRWDGEKVTFTVPGGTSIEPPKVSELTCSSFTDAAVITFESGEPFEGDAVITYGRAGKSEVTEMRIKSFEPGKYAVVIRGLEPDSKTYTANIWFELDGYKGNTRSVSFMTKTKPDIEWPYMYLNYAERNSTGGFVKGSRFPLWVNNTSDAEDVKWYFNDKEVSAPDFHFNVTESGTLKAVIYNKDGSEDVIIKEILVNE